MTFEQEARKERAKEGVEGSRIGGTIGVLGVVEL